MERAKTILLCATLAITAGCASLGPVDSDTVVAAIPGDTIRYVEGGAPWDPVEELTLVLPEHRVRIECYRNGDARMKTNANSRLDEVVSDDEWNWVAAQLAKSDVKNWSGSYPGAGYQDGTSWWLEFRRGSNVVQQARGSNNRSRHYREFRAIKRWAEGRAHVTLEGLLSWHPDECRKAERGDPSAQVFLGDLMLLFGERDRAAEWFQKAAWQGDTNALERLRRDFPEKDGTTDGIELVRECLAKAGFSTPGAPPDVDRPEPKTLKDFADVLNAETWDGYDEVLGQYNVYDTVISEIHLPGVSDPMIFLRIVSGSIMGSSVYVLRRDPETGKWRNLHAMDDEDGLGDMVLIPVESDGRTRFLEVGVDFETKLQSGFAVYDYDPEKDEWTAVASARVRHSFQPEQTGFSNPWRWISEKRFLEIVENRPDLDSGTIPLGNRVLEVERFDTDVGYRPSGYFLRVLEGTEQVWPKTDENGDARVFVRGFLPVQRSRRHHVVLLDYDRNEDGFGVSISVLDADTLDSFCDRVVPDRPFLELVPFDRKQQ